MYYFNTNLVQQYRGTAYSSCSTVVRHILVDLDAKCIYVGRLDAK
jgi:hypothetical protein